MRSASQKNCSPKACTRSSRRIQRTGRQSSRGASLPARIVNEESCITFIDQPSEANLPLECGLKLDCSGDCEAWQHRENEVPSLNLSLVQRSVTGPIASFERGIDTGIRPYSTCGWYQSEFREEERLGEGGFGVVYRSVHLLSNHSFAIKKVRLAGTKQKEVDALLREVRTLAKVGSHCNVVRYYNAWLEPSRCDDHAVSRSMSHPHAHVEIVGSPPEPYSIADELYESGTSHDQSDRMSSSLHSIHQLSSVASSECEFSWERGPSEDGSKDDDGESPCKVEPCASLIVAQRNDQRSSFLPPLAQDGLWGYTLYLQMELCTRSTLQDSLSSRERKEVNVAGTLHILAQVLCALDWVHSQGIVHRDVKPSNLFIHPDGTVKLGDFGLARDVGAEDRDNDVGGDVECRRLSQGNTRRNHTSGVGTHVYASPEQLSGHICTDRSDIFSVGVLIVEMFHIFTTGMERIMTLSHARNGILPAKFGLEHPHICSATLECLNHDPMLRPSAAQLLHKLNLLDPYGRSSAVDARAPPRINITSLPSPAIQPSPSPAMSPCGTGDDGAFSLGAANVCTTSSTASSANTNICAIPTPPPSQPASWSSQEQQQQQQQQQPPQHSALGDGQAAKEGFVRHKGTSCGGECSACDAKETKNSAQTAARRTLDMLGQVLGQDDAACTAGDCGGECEHHKRVAELEDMVKMLLVERESADRRVKELENTIQRQASLAATLLCNPTRSAFFGRKHSTQLGLDIDVA